MSGLGSYSPDVHDRVKCETTNAGTIHGRVIDTGESCRTRLQSGQKLSDYWEDPEVRDETPAVRVVTDAGKEYLYPVTKLEHTGTSIWALRVTVNEAVLQALDDDDIRTLEDLDATPVEYLEELVDSMTAPDSNLLKTIVETRDALMEGRDLPADDEECERCGAPLLDPVTSAEDRTFCSIGCLNDQQME